MPMTRTFASPTDRHLLYIACTRAMHRLTLIHVGEVTRFLQPEDAADHRADATAFVASQASQATAVSGESNCRRVLKNGWQPIAAHADSLKIKPSSKRFGSSWAKPWSQHLTTLGSEASVPIKPIPGTLPDIAKDDSGSGFVTRMPTGYRLGRCRTGVACQPSRPSEYPSIAYTVFANLLPV